VSKQYMRSYGLLRSE